MLFRVAVGRCGRVDRVPSSVGLRTCAAELLVPVRIFRMSTCTSYAAVVVEFLHYVHDNCRKQHSEPT
jgi:hypothetical protein